MGGRAFEALAHELIAVFRRGVEQELSDSAFGELALRCFRYQFDRNPVYERFCRGRGVTPESVGHWTGVPAVPTRAFKHLRLISGPPGRVEAVFRTSGTTLGGESRGEHHVLSLALYREAVLPNFRANLLPDGARLPILSLIPSPRRAPDSSLSRMMGMVADEFGAEGGGWYLDPDEGIRELELIRALRGHQEASRPVLLAGTAFSFVHWMDAMDRKGRRFVLPDGSRVMETGGFKGRSRVVPREELYEALEERTAVPPERVVNEYGMTELLSQFYARSGEPHAPPPWVRTRVLDPVSLEPRERGTPGILCHFDLANLGSVCSVLTEDRGVAEGKGFRVLGRAPGSEPRGCSLAMDELLAGAS